MQTHQVKKGYKLVKLHQEKELEIPENWEFLPLRNVVKVNKQTIDPSKYPKELFELYSIPAYHENGKPEIRYGKEIHSIKFTVENRTVLFGKINPNLPKIWFVDSQTKLRKITSTEFIQLSENDKSVAGFIYYLAWSPFLLSRSKSVTTGTTPSRERVEPKKFLDLLIPVPPRIEQTKISLIISNVDKLIQQTQKIIEQTQRLKKGLMQRLLTKGIEHTKFKKTKLGEIPEEWIETKLGSFIMLQRGHDLPDNLRIKGNIPVIGSNGIVGYHNENKAKGPGVIIGRSGTLGKVYYVEDDYWPLNTSLYVKEFYSSHPKFVYYFLQNIKYENFNAGTSVPTLNRNHLHPLRITIPKFAEQQEIASILSNIDTLIQKKHENKSKLETLKKGLMQKLLTGQIRVKV